MQYLYPVNLRQIDSWLIMLEFWWWELFNLTNLMTILLLNILYMKIMRLEYLLVSSASMWTLV